MSNWMPFDGDQQQTTGLISLYIEKKIGTKWHPTFLLFKLQIQIQLQLQFIHILYWLTTFYFIYSSYSSADSSPSESDSSLNSIFCWLAFHLPITTCS